MIDVRRKEPAEKKAVGSILQYADTYKNELSNEQRGHIREMLLDPENTQEDVVDWLMGQLNLDEGSLSSLRRLVTMPIDELLEPATRTSRRLMMQAKNAERGRASVDYVEAGRKGIRSRMRKTGKNAAGHDLWTEAELADLRPLLEIPEMHHQEGKRAGKINATLVSTKFLEIRPTSQRNIDSIRSAVRRLLEQKNASREVLTEFIEAPHNQI